MTHKSFNDSACGVTAQAFMAFTEIQSSCPKGEEDSLLHFNDKGQIVVIGADGAQKEVLMELSPAV